MESPGRLSYVELNAELDAPVAVSPVFTHFRANLASVCWVQHLLQTNRARLYGEVVKGVLARVTQHGQNAQPFNPGRRKDPFELISIPGDGKCGWRALLAAQDVAAYKAIPRIGLFGGLTSVMFI